MRLWTIGHSTHDLDDFMGMLRSHGIEVLADVRSLPGSRRYPHFNKEDLAVSLLDLDIQYMHFKELGGKRRPQKDSTNTVWRNLSFRAYADYMETPDFLGGVESLLRVAAKRRVALMCSEAVWWRCHRSMISDHLKAAGHEVVHIMSDSTAHDKVHPYTKAASIVGGRLVYGPESATLALAL